MTNEQLRDAITDIVTDAWDRSRQIDGAVDEIMDAVALAIQHPSQSDYEAVLADHKRLVRELDVLLNGEAGAAQQASLADLVAQVRRQGIRAELPSQSAGEPAGWQMRFRTSPECAVDPANRAWSGWKWASRRRIDQIKADKFFDVEERQVFTSPPPTDAARVEADGISALVAAHARLIEEGNNHAYFELAYTRQTGWMAWITDKPLYGAQPVNPDRKVLFKGQGDTPQEACSAALAAERNNGIRPAGGEHA